MKSDRLPKSLTFLRRTLVPALFVSASMTDLHHVFDELEEVNEVAEGKACPHSIRH